MATARIRGKWLLSLSVHESVSPLTPRSIAQAELDVHTATRAGLSGELRIGQQAVPVKGRVKPGSPAVITLSEALGVGKSAGDGLQAILYIPPWWPNVDYSYDLISGTLVVGESSALQDKGLRRRIISVTGVQPFE